MNTVKEMGWKWSTTARGKEMTSSLRNNLCAFRCQIVRLKTLCCWDVLATMARQQTPHGCSECLCFPKYWRTRPWTRGSSRNQLFERSRATVAHIWIFSSAGTNSAACKCRRQALDQVGGRYVPSFWLWRSCWHTWQSIGDPEHCQGSG